MVLFVTGTTMGKSIFRARQSGNYHLLLSLNVPRAVEILMRVRASLAQTTAT
jgi:hypothetical protein